MEGKYSHLFVRITHPQHYYVYKIIYMTWIAAVVAAAVVRPLGGVSEKLLVVYEVAVAAGVGRLRSSCANSPPAMARLSAQGDC